MGRNQIHIENSLSELETILLSHHCCPICSISPHYVQ